MSAEITIGKLEVPHIMVTWCAYSTELLGKAKALLPIWRRKSETSREMDYAEIKASNRSAKVYKQCLISSLEIGSTTIPRGSRTQVSSKW